MKKKINNIIVLIFLFPIIIFGQKKEFPIETTHQVLTQEITKILKETGIPSISISLIKEDYVVWSEAFGYTNVKKQIPATSSTIYNTASTFKLITATAIMQLADQGKLNIDDPINNYLGDLAIDNFSKDGPSITFRHLMSHHSGIKDSLIIKPIWKKELIPELKEIVMNAKPIENPGVNYEYCNIGYAILGLLIEKISKETFDNYIVGHILKPLNIKTENPIFPTPSMVEEMALPYNILNNKSVPEYQYIFNAYPAGDTYLTSSDMATFLSIQLNNGKFKGNVILSPEAISEMQNIQFESDYGLGTAISKEEDFKTIEHEGSTYGFSSFYKLDLNNNVGVYIASNSGGANDVLKAITNLSINLLNNKPVEKLKSFKRKEFIEIELSTKALNKYVGMYEIKEDIFFEVTLKDNQLSMTPTNEDTIEIFPYEETKFYFQKFYAQVEFTIQKEKVVSLDLIINGNIISAIKKK